MNSRRSDNQYNRGQPQERTTEEEELSEESPPLKPYFGYRISGPVALGGELRLKAGDTQDQLEPSVTLDEPEIVAAAAQRADEADITVIRIPPAAENVHPPTGEPGWKFQTAMESLPEYDSVGQKRIRVQLSWENITVVPKDQIKKGKPIDAKEPRKILNEVSGSVRPMESLAIIGASGAGKTTLLNYLSNKMFPNDLKATGVTKINGIPREQLDYFKFTAFVQQDDILMETLTVKGKRMTTR